MKILLTDRFLSYLSGSQLMQTPDNLEAHGYGLAGQLLIQDIWAAKRRKNGSRSVEVSDQQAEVLREFAQTMAAVAADNTWEADGRADLASARALLRHLDKV